MANKKITQLDPYSSMIDTDVMPIVDITAVVTKKTTWSSIKSVLKAYFDTIYGAFSFTTIPASSPLASGIVMNLTAFDTQAFGDVAFVHSGGKAAIAKADVIANASSIVMCSAPAGILADASGAYIVHGIARNDSWTWTVGGLIYLTTTGTTGNTMSQTPPNATNQVVQILGVATHANRMYFNPQLVQIELL